MPQSRRRSSEPKEAVNHPAHYGGDTVYEVIKVLEAWELPPNLWQSVKYISRAGKKDPAKTLEDLKKAAFYLNREIETLERGRTIPEAIEEVFASLEQIGEQP